MNAKQWIVECRDVTLRSSLGRFLQADPFQFAAGDVNLYRYVGNIPTYWSDPSGLSVVIAPPPPVTTGGGATVIGGGLGGAVAQGFLTGWAIGRIADNLSGGALSDIYAHTFDSSYGMFENSRRWSCDATCNVQAIPGQDGCCPDRVNGTATGPSEDAACRAAKRVATQSCPRGCYPRHCGCRCRKQ